MIILTILWFFLALGILVTIHEFGHFYLARRCGVKVLRFSIGFGRALWRWHDRYDTEFVIAAIPLGGYVKMLDERDGEIAERERHLSFNSKTVWQRMSIVLAGPVANFILAVFLYFVLAVMGSTGIAPVIGSVSEGKPAALAGLKKGDEIIAVDQAAVSTWADVFSQLIKRIGDTGEIELTVSASVIESSPHQIDIPITRWLGSTDRPDVLTDLGITVYVPESAPVIDSIQKGSAAVAAGLQAGDLILSADKASISNWQQWVKYVQERPETRIMLQVQRQGRYIELEITPDVVEQNGKQLGRAGVTARINWPPEMLRPIEYTLSEAVIRGFTRTWEQAGFVVSFIKKLIFAEVSVKNLGGSLTIAQAAGDSARAGVVSYIAFIAFLSVSLGVFNLLPIPVLDGGHLLYYVIEAIKGSPVSDNVQLVGYQVGFFLVVSVMVVAHINDFVRLFAG